MLLLVILQSTLYAADVNAKALLYTRIDCWKCAVLSVKTTLLFSFSCVLLRSFCSSGGVSPRIGNVTARFEQHHENIGTTTVELVVFSSIQCNALHFVHLNISKKQPKSSTLWTSGLIYVIHL